MRNCMCWYMARLKLSVGYQSSVVSYQLSVKAFSAGRSRCKR
jgi:hypothetical protein